MGFHLASTDVREAWVLGLSYNANKRVPEGGVIPALFAESRTVFIP